LYLSQLFLSGFLLRKVLSEFGLEVLKGPRESGVALWRARLQLIGRYLRAGVMLPDGHREATTQGVPQGGPLSPLLANIMLDPLDKELEKRGHRFARYADDFLILVRSARAARRVMQSVIRFVEVGLGLVVNRQKSQAAPLSRCTFLGFALRRGKVVWTDKAYRRIKEITSRSWGVSMSRRLEELRRYAVGWLNYFGISHTYPIRRLAPSPGQPHEPRRCPAAAPASWRRHRVQRCGHPRLDPR
jgi:hypothetical protein